MPAGLRRTHRIADGVWGVLRVRAGSLVFVDEDTVPVGSEGAVTLVAGDSLVISPGVAHHVEPDPDARFTIEFHR